MTRIKRGSVSRKRHNKSIKRNKGYRGSATYRVAHQKNMKASRHAYRARRLKKRLFRKLWITRFNAFLRWLGTIYSKFINVSKEKDMTVNRKLLAQLATRDPKAVKQLTTKMF